MSVAIVNYKSPDITPACMNLLRDAVDVSCVPIWVVDNASHDASVDYLKTLDWINLIERVQVPGEPGYMAHGRALDLILERVTTKYLLLLHTDTFIYEASIIKQLLSKGAEDDRIFAVGCLEPVCRSTLHRAVRYVTRGPKYYFRRLKQTLGLKTRAPKLHYEKYLKSFCALWNVDIIKRHGMSFAMTDNVPGYEMQDRLTALGYRFVVIPPKQMFRALDHIEKATASVKDGDRINSRKQGRYQKIVSAVRAQKSNDLSE